MSVAQTLSWISLLMLTSFGTSQEAMGSPLKLSSRLYSTLRDEPENFVFSPYSVSEAMAMTYEGANGKTAQEISEVCDFHLEKTKSHSVFFTTRTSLKKLSSESVQLVIANSLWPETSFPLRADFVNVLKTFYLSSVEAVDFRHQADSARRRINQWVEHETRNNIQELLPVGSLNEDTSLLLVNAVYFKADWEFPFNSAHTKETDFFSKNGEPRKVRMMTQSRSFGYSETESFQTVTLPYASGRLSMVVVLPNASVTLDLVEDAMVDGSLMETIAKSRSEKVLLFLPKFRLEWGTKSLVPSLRKLGISDAFNRDTADFSGISDNWKSDPADRLFIADVLHRAFIEVNEEGTEAAAATAVILARDGAALREPPPKIFRADRPFLFLIRDDVTKTILFLGRILEPPA